jgi:hypothetical protein
MVSSKMPSKFSYIAKHPFENEPSMLLDRSINAALPSPALSCNYFGSPLSLDNITFSSPLF